MKKKPTALKTLCARGHVVVALIEKLTAERKKLYEEHDGIVAALRAAQPLEAKVALEEYKLRLISPFEKGNTQWGHGPVRQFVLELAEEPPPAPAKK